MYDESRLAPSRVDDAATRAERILLLMRATEDRQLLSDWLDDRYRLVVGSTADVLDREFDLCLVDEATFPRALGALEDRKRDAAPTFLPYVLLLGDGSGSSLDRRLWDHVDEIVRTPVEKADLHGRLTGLLLRRNLSRMLAQQNKRITQILRTIPDPLLIVDDTSTVVTTNPAFGDYTGCERSQVEGARLADIDAFPADTVERLRRIATGADTEREGASDRRSTAEMDAGAAVDERTISYWSADGTVRYAEVGAAPLSDVPSTHRETLVILRDVTERLDHERALARDRDRLNDFTDMLAHEIRNPLNIAQGYVRMLTADDELEEDALRRVVTAQTRMEQMIKELLAHTRGDYASAVQTVDLAQIVRVAWDQTPTGEATLAVELDGLTLDADPENFQTILENLFRNAMEHAGTEAAVRVGSLEGGFYVEDDGPGIPPAERERVFERGVTNRSAGTGLGLALVRKVVDAHGWTIAITENSDGGARFEITGVDALASGTHG